MFLLLIILFGIGYNRLKKSTNFKNNFLLKIGDFLVWKAAIISFFLSKVGFSLFTWANL